MYVCVKLSTHESSHHKYRRCSDRCNLCLREATGAQQSVQFLRRRFHAQRLRSDRADFRFVVAHCYQVSRLLRSNQRLFDSQHLWQLPGAYRIGLRTFTLPNPPPPNGSCVAIGDFALAGIGSNANVYLTVSSNGLPVDGTTQPGTQSQVGWESTLYCSDGSGYWRMGHAQTTPSTIGPWLKTVDTGTTNALKTTFVHGMNFGMTPGTMFYIRPINSNTSSTVTLSVNGYPAKNIFKFGNEPLAPGDLTITAYAHVFYDGTNWQLLNPQTAKGTITSVTATAPLVSTGGATPNISCPTCITTTALTGTTARIGGTALTAGSCTSGTATVTGATVGHPVLVSASNGSLPNGRTILSAAVTTPGTVTVQLCATARYTPTANTYNVATQ